MADYYLDASALVKRYAKESGSDWILRITTPGSEDLTLLADITLADVAAALAAKRRAPQGVSREERDRALSRFLQECDEYYLLVHVDRVVIDLAVALTQGHHLRGYDAAQLASALVTNVELVTQDHPPLVFVAADEDLLFAAEAEGLSTENPLNYADEVSPLH
jgi:predicted nucleic acid-binding protein